MDPVTLLYLRIMTGLLGVCAAVLIGATFSERSKERRLNASGAFSEATVQRELPVARSQRKFEVVFDVNGQPHTAIVQSFSALAAGSRVRVRYDPDDPTQAVITAPAAAAATTGHWVRTAIYAAIASVGFIICLGFLLG